MPGPAMTEQWPLLAALTGEQRAAVLDATRKRTFKRNEIVFHEGDPGETLHLVAKGRLAVRVTTAMGEVATIRIHAPGSHFGELAVVDPAPRAATIVALEPAETLSLHRDAFKVLRRDHPGIDQLLITALTDEVRRLSLRLVDAMYTPAPERMVGRLLELAAIYGPPADGAITIPLTQEDLAGLCGTTRPTANQILQRLVDRGLLELARGKIRILDVAGLEARLR